MLNIKNLPVLDFDNNDGIPNTKLEEKLWKGCVEYCKKLIEIQQTRKEYLRIFLECKNESLIELFAIKIDYDKVICYRETVQLSNRNFIHKSITILDSETINHYLTMFNNFSKPKIYKKALQHFKTQFIILNQSNAQQISKR